MNRLMIGVLACTAAFVAPAANPTASELNAKYGIKDRVSFRLDANGEPVAVLRNAHGSCEVMLRGGHVISCAFAGDAHPLLFVPGKGYVVTSGPRDFIHGGVPLLWPWFGGSGAPKPPADYTSWWSRKKREWGWEKPFDPPFHATARYSLFAVKDVSDKDGETSVTLTLGPCAEVAEYTDGDFELDYRVTLGAHKLGLRLTTTNRGDAPFKLREGYHPYFCVSDCFGVALDGCDGCAYESTRDLPNDLEGVWRGKVPEWPGCDLFKFKEPKSVITLEDPAWKRNIVLTTTGARDVVTWCQDIKGAKRGGMNITADECRGYFCIEPANYYDESEVSVAKGESHVFETVITVVDRK